MNGTRRWRDTGHLQRAVETAGSREAFDAAVGRIEAGDVSTKDVLARYIAALGGTLKLIADFGDEQLKIA